MNKKLLILILGILFVMSFLVKFVRFDDPYFGSHLSRQLFTMSTIDSFSVEGIDLLKPRTNYAGYPGYLVLEAPIYQAVSALLSSMVGDPLVSARMLSLLFAAFSIVFVYFIASFWFERKTAIYSSLFFAFAPINIMFHRASMIDVSCVGFALCAYLTLQHWLRENSKWWHAVVFTVAGSLCVLIKPLYFLPVVILLITKIIIQSSPFSISSFYNCLRKYIGVIIAFFLISCVLFGWLYISAEVSTGTKVLNHVGWGSLLNPKFYFNLGVRFFRQFLNPFSAALFILGTFCLWGKYRKDERIQLLVIPLTYYLLFPNVNLPHAYYSLIMIPFFAIVAGVGASWVEDSLIQQGLVKRQLSIRVPIYVFSSLVSIIMFSQNIAVSTILPSQRYEKMAEEIAPILTPMEYSVVYVNQKGSFDLADRLRNRPSVFLSSFFKDLPEEKIMQKLQDMPLVAAAVLYAIKQYGEMIYIEPNEDIRFPEKVAYYNNELRYVLFYLFEKQKNIRKQMKPHTLVYESKDWLVYDLVETDRRFQ